MDCPACGGALPPVADPTQRSVDCPSCGQPVDLRAAAGATKAVRLEGDPDPLVGRTVGGGRYRIDAPLGRGGMGTVYRGTQISLGRSVAIKLLAPDLTSDETFLRRFRREAGVLAALQHPSVVTIHDTGDEEGLPYIVMAYVAGPDGEPLSLRRVLDAGPLDPDLALRLASEIGAGLAFAHERGIVHRDVKPANVLLDAGWHALVADFGIARARLGSSPDPTLTAPGSSMGTWKYMAPEQWIDAARIDARSDVYSAGVLLYEMLTGQLPEGRFEMPTEVRPGVDPRVDAVLGRALQRDPDRRYAEMVEMVAEIDAIRAGSASGGVPTMAPIAAPGLPGPVSSAWSSPTPTPTPSRTPVPSRTPAPTPAGDPGPSRPFTPSPPGAPGPSRSPAPTPARTPAPEPFLVAAPPLVVAPAALPRPGSVLAAIVAVGLLLAAGAEVLGVLALAIPRDLDITRTRVWYLDGDIRRPFYYEVVDEEVQLGIVAVCSTVALAAWLLLAAWIHRAWRSVPPPWRRLSPAAAAWLLLVPVFCLYWVFRSVAGLSTALRDAARGAAPAARVGEAGRGLGVVASASAVVPGLSAILLLVWVLVANAARNRLLRALGPPR